MEQLYAEYGDLVEFRLIYINEAHPCDGGNPNPHTIEKRLFTHTSFESRREIARRFVADKKITIPCLIDNLDNATDLAYRAWPDKIYIVRSNGILAFVGSDGPFGFPESMNVARQWLQEYDLTGIEPPPLKGSLDDFGAIVAGEIQPFGHQDDIIASLRAWQESEKANEETANEGAGEKQTEDPNEALPVAENPARTKPGKTSPVSNNDPSEAQAAAKSAKRFLSSSTMLLAGLACLVAIAVVLYWKQG